MYLSTYVRYRTLVLLARGHGMVIFLTYYIVLYIPVYQYNIYDFPDSIPCYGMAWHGMVSVHRLLLPYHLSIHLPPLSTLERERAPHD